MPPQHPLELFARQAATKAPPAVVLCPGDERANFKNWRDWQMALRWGAAGMIVGVPLSSAGCFGAAHHQHWEAGVKP